ncbi:hypothetical protein QTO34_015973 [Cnephaeus nilssonii]|uniref:Uncharacterized protein n=1 Tax=Cnephaeus nilssonii TaxID=3371016 RepID=A0AA40I5C0_CNENI|nr:hypothetical protein QTO34_015973 [Eptesicus nilssonii]
MNKTGRSHCPVPICALVGRQSITCLMCQSTGYIPVEQVNELVALILQVIRDCALIQLNSHPENQESNFYSVAVTSLSSQVHYMNTVVGSCVTTNSSLIPPWREPLVHFHGAGGEGRTIFLCVLLLHNIVIFMRTPVEISYI